MSASLDYSWCMPVPQSGDPRRGPRPAKVPLISWGSSLWPHHSLEPLRSLRSGADVPMERSASIATSSNLRTAAAVSGVANMRWKALLLGTILIGGCAAWVDVNRVCQADAARVLQASATLPPKVQQMNYEKSYERCVAAYGFSDHLQATNQRAN